MLASSFNSSDTADRFKRSTNQVVIECPAKMNLALSVGSPEELHDGYHPIASWMIAVNLCDCLTLSKQDGGKSRFDIRYSQLAPQPQRIDWPMEKDLAVRAHAAVQRLADRQLPVQMTLEKYIPAGAGLAGGSSDAAGMIYGLNRLFELNLDNQQLLSLAGELGSDVYFLTWVFLGKTAALVTGFGDKINPIDYVQSLRMVLILPPFVCSTAAVYAAFDQQLDGLKYADEQKIWELIGCTALNSKHLSNDLARPAMQVQPQLKTVIEKLGNIANRPVHITGSGAAMFIMTRSNEESHSLAKQITSLTDLPALAVRSIHNQIDLTDGTRLYRDY